MAYSHLSLSEREEIVRKYCELKEEGLPVCQRRFAKRYGLQAIDFQILLRKYGQAFGWEPGRGRTNGVWRAEKNNRENTQYNSCME